MYSARLTLLILPQPEILLTKISLLIDSIPSKAVVRLKHILGVGEVIQGASGLYASDNAAID